MARSSFTLRKVSDSSALGSYLQYPPSFGASVPGLPIRTENDLYLRGDGYAEPTLITTDTGYFSAEPIDYNLVELKWGASLTDTLAATPAPTQVIVCYSPVGEPNIVTEGYVIMDTSTETYAVHEVPSGKWAYYSLFLKYESNSGDLYYELASSLSVLVPYNYGSTDNMFRRIPAYYRDLDWQLSTGNGGPLYRFLSIFGWDTDRFRTLLDYLITSKDPAIARSQELDVLAEDLGVDLRSNELGAARLRSLLNDIGTIRRSTGTIAGIQDAISAITRSTVEVDTTVSPIEIRVYPQRVNLIKDPKLASGFAASLDGGLSGSTYTTSVEGGFYNESLADDPNPPSDGAYPSTSYGASVGYWSQFNSPSASGVAICETITADIAVSAGDTFYFSVHGGGQDLVLLVSLDSASGTRTRVVTAPAPQLIAGVKYWKLAIPSDYAGVSTLSLHIEYNNTDPTKIALFKDLLLEENHVGTYFDGDSTRGGWVVDDVGSSSDFQWYDPTTNPPSEGTANASFSSYNENFQKTKFVVNRLLPSLLPVNKLVTSGTIYSNREVPIDKCTIIWNYLPGY